MAILAALLFLPSCAAAGPSAEQAADDGKKPAVVKEESLKERDLWGQETARLRREGKIREAIQACAKMLAIEREVFGDLHEDVAGSLGQLAEMHEGLGDFERAEACRKEILVILAKLYGEKDWRVTDARLALEDVERLSGLTQEERQLLSEADELTGKMLQLDRKGKSGEALSLALRIVDIRGRILGKAHHDYATSLSNMGVLCKRMGEYDRSEPLLLQALEIRKTVLGEGHPDCAMSLNNLASLYRDMGQYARAEPLFKLGLEITRTALGEQHLNCATIASNLAMLYQKIGNYAGAEPLYREALQIRKMALGEQHLDYATSLSNLGTLYHAIGDYPRAEPLLREALGILKTALGEENPDYATGLNCLGVLCKDMGDYPRAELLLRQALEIRRRAYGEGHPSCATSLNNLAMLYQAMGDYIRAEPLFQQALKIRQSTLGASHADSASSLSNLATLYLDMGDYSLAEPLLRQALEIRRRTLREGHDTCAVSLSSLGLLYHSLGDYARAEPLYRQALEIDRRALGETHIGFAADLHNLASLYKTMGDYARAEPLYRQALAIKKKTIGEAHPGYAASLNNLGALYSDMGDHAHAEPLYKQALEIYERTLGEGHPGYATSLNGLGAALMAMGDCAGAEPLLRRALEINERAFGEGHARRAAALANLSMLYENMGDYARAEPLLEQAIEITGKALGESHPEHAASLSHLAWLYHHMGHSSRAVPLVRQALEVSIRNLELASSIQSERQQLAMLRSLQDALNAYLSIAPLERVPADEVYGRILHWKGTVFSRQRRMRLERKRPELAPLFSELQSASSRLATLAFSVPDPRNREVWSRQISELTHRKEQLEGELSRQSAEYVREKTLARLSAEDLRSALPRESVLIDVFEYSRITRRQDSGASKTQERRDRKSPWNVEEHFAAFVVRAEAPVALADLGPSEPLEDAIEAWRSAILSAPGSKGGLESATVLRKSLWEPLEKHLSGARTVLVSPAGALGRCPWGALPGSKPGAYLIEEVSIALMPVPEMLSELLSLKKPVDSQPSLLVVGDVDFDAESLAADPPAVQDKKDDTPMEGLFLRGEVREAPRGGGLFNFGRIDSTGPEILMLGDTFRAVHPDGKLSRFTGKEATEAAVRGAAPEHEFVHLATHGFFAPKEINSALTPSKAEGTGGAGPGLGPAANLAGWHPGLLSGIVLAGGNGKPSPERDDGILTALELATLDLGRTELIVLSACETGLGATAGGEGLLGLQRAAQVAGARTVVASLWKVGDAETQAVMSRFYQNLLAKKMSKLEALRDAQLALLRRELIVRQGAAEGPGRGVSRVGEVSRLESIRAPVRDWAAWVLSGDWR